MTNDVVTTFKGVRLYKKLEQLQVAGQLARVPYLRILRSIAICACCGRRLCRVPKKDKLLGPCEFPRQAGGTVLWQCSAAAIGRADHPPPAPAGALHHGISRRPCNRRPTAADRLRSHFLEGPTQYPACAPRHRLAALVLRAAADRARRKSTLDRNCTSCTTQLRVSVPAGLLAGAPRLCAELRRQRGVNSTSRGPEAISSDSDAADGPDALEQAEGNSGPQQEGLLRCLQSNLLGWKRCRREPRTTACWRCQEGPTMATHLTG